MKKPSLFKLSPESVSRLEAATAFYGRLGHKATKTDLVEKAIQTLATNEDELADGQRSQKSKPLPPLLSAYRAWIGGDRLTRSQLLMLAQAAHKVFRQHRGMYNREYVADMLRAAKAVIGLRPSRVLAGDVSGLDSQYLSNLYVRKETVAGSIEATIEQVMGPSFAGPADLPLRVLVGALRDEPSCDENDLNAVVAPYLTSLFRLAIRCNWVDTGQQFWDPERPEPSNGDYWAGLYQSSRLQCGPFELDWGADHKTAGIMLEDIERGIGVEFRSFPALTDFLCLAQNLRQGGEGGDRADIRLEKNSPLMDAEGAMLVVGLDVRRMRLRLDDAQLEFLLSLVGMLVSDKKFMAKYSELCLVYGDI